MEKSLIWSTLDISRDSEWYDQPIFFRANESLQSKVMIADFLLRPHFSVYCHYIVSNNFTGSMKPYTYNQIEWLIIFTKEWNLKLPVLSYISKYTQPQSHGTIYMPSSINVQAMKRNVGDTHLIMSKNIS